MEFDDIVSCSQCVTKVSGYIPNHTYQFRLCLVGDPFVGKTSLLKRYYDSKFSSDYVNTIGCDFKVVTLDVKGQIVKLQMWDTAGQERFKAISVNYFRSAQAFLFVFDLSKKESLLNIENWVQIALSNNKNSAKSILVGNKSDLVVERQVNTTEAIEFSKKYDMAYLEASALNDENVKEAFHYLAYTLASNYSNLGSNSKGVLEESEGDYKSITFNKNQDLARRKIRSSKRCCK